MINILLKFNQISLIYHILKFKNLFKSILEYISLQIMIKLIKNRIHNAMKINMALNLKEIIYQEFWQKMPKMVIINI